MIKKKNRKDFDIEMTYKHIVFDFGNVLAKFDPDYLLGCLLYTSELSLPPGRYAITSNYLKEEYFEIENSNEKWTLKVDYHNNTLKITENNK